MMGWETLYIPFLFLSLAEHISLALGSEFKIYLPQLVPQMIRVLSHDTSKDRNVTGKLLAALRKFGPTLNDYMNLILPKIVALFDLAETPMAIRRSGRQFNRIKKCPKE